MFVLPSNEKIHCPPTAHPKIQDREKLLRPEGSHLENFGWWMSRPTETLASRLLVFLFIFVVFVFFLAQKQSKKRKNQI